MTETTKGQDSVEIWMDGECSLCQASRSWCELRDDQERLRFADFRRESDDHLPVERSQLEGSMWIRDADGSLHSGFDAWRRIMSKLPGWGWLVWLTGLPPLRWIGPKVYDLIARNRHRLAKRRAGSGQTGAGKPWSATRS
jgi:predicted DCC family thiol-disulfide oxidoreductase YuxK